MNQKILQAAKSLLESQQSPNFSASDALIVAIGYTYTDAEKAFQLLNQALLEAPNILPFPAILLRLIQKHTKDQDLVKIRLKELYFKIVNYHHFLYEHYDLEEEGLPCNPMIIGQLQDPLFLSLLIEANESLIQIGHSLQENVLEIIQWNELTIYTMNEKLWDKTTSCYQSYDSRKNIYIPATHLNGFAPLVGEVPTQERAEQMLVALNQVLHKDSQINVLERWMLQRGLLRYDFVEDAALIRHELLQLFTERGFYDNYDRKTYEPFTNHQSLQAAALAIDLIRQTR